MSSYAQEPLAVARAFVEALKRGDSDELVRLLDEGFIMESAYPILAGEDQPGSRRCGPEAARNFFATISSILSYVRFRDESWRTTTDRLVLFEAEGEMAYLDGRPYNNSYLWFFEVKDGRISRLKEYFSPVVWARANGVPLEALP